MSSTLTTTTPVNLVDKYSKRTNLLREIAECRKNKAAFSDTSPAFDLKAGDKIIFLAGYDGNIPMLGEIWAFNTEGNAMIIWDCFWSPVILSTRLVRKHEAV